MIDKLEYLLAVAQEKHFGRAAQACGVTQPTLSAGIRYLEDALGVLLIKRGSRFIGLTEEGERVLGWARRIVADVRGMKQEVDSLKKGLTGHLRLAAIPTALPIVATLTAAFHAQYPDVQYTILSRTSQETLQLLANLDIDAGLTYLDNEPLGRVSSVPIYPERYCLLTKAKGPFADRASVTWEEVGQAPLCLLTPDMQNRRILDRYLSRTGAPISAQLESNSMIVLFAHIQTGHWSGIMPEKLVGTSGTRPELRAIPIEDQDAAITVGLVAGAREPMTPLVSAFIKEAKRFAATQTR